MSSEWFIAPNGNDITGDGTITNPCKTLAKISTIAKAGNTVNIRGGLYRHDVISGGGSADNYIIYQAYSNEVVKFYSQEITDAAISIYANYCELNNVQIESSSHIGIVIWNCSNVKISKCTISRCDRSGIYVGGDSTKLVYNNIIINDNSISNTCLIKTYDLEEPVGLPGALVVNKTTNVTISKNTIYENHGEGCVVSNSIHSCITNNTIYDNVGANIYCDNAGYILIDGNYIHNTSKTKFINADTPASAIVITNENKEPFINSEHITIQNNILSHYKYGIYYNPVDRNSGLHNCQIFNNTFHRGYHECIFIGNSMIPHSDIEIVNNIFDHTKSYKPLDAIEDITGFKFHHNGWSHEPTKLGGVGDIIGDPKLVLRKGYEATAIYKLRDVSPMRDQGVYIKTVTTDYWGNLRTAPYCMGAHELDVRLAHYSTSVRSIRYPAHM